MDVGAEVLDFGSAGCGDDPRLALRMREELVADMERAHAPRAEVFGARHRLAGLTTKAGDYGRAQQLWRWVIVDEQAANGRFHLNTLEARKGLAECIDEAGDPAAAARFIREIIADAEHLGAPRSRHLLLYRRLLARWTGRSGDPDGAIRQLQQLVTIATNELGDTDTATLDLRHRLAYWTREAGDPTSAVAMLRQLINDAKNGHIPNREIITKCEADLERWLPPPTKSLNAINRDPSANRD
jgi:hypothetical protein